MKQPVDSSQVEKKDMYDKEQTAEAKLRTFQRPMDVVEADDMPASEKLAILKAWEVDERALQRAEDEGMGGGEHAHLQKVQAALAHLGKHPCLNGVEKQRRACAR